MARLVRLSAWLASGPLAVSRRCVTRWLRDGLRGEFPPAGAARRIAGRWWIDPAQFDSWLHNLGFAVADDTQAKMARVQAVYMKHRKDFPNG